MAIVRDHLGMDVEICAPRVLFAQVLPVQKHGENGVLALGWMVSFAAV